LENAIRRFTIWPPEVLFWIREKALEAHAPCVIIELRNQKTNQRQRNRPCAGRKLKMSEAIAQGPVDVTVTPDMLPACRDKNGHMAQYQGRIVYVHDDWRLVYHDTLDGRHTFVAEHSTRTNLGGVSFAAAKAAMIELAAYERDNPLA
jgi:hypothetical protein